MQKLGLVSELRRVTCGSVHCFMLRTDWALVSKMAASTFAPILGFVFSAQFVDWFASVEVNIPKK